MRSKNTWIIKQGKILLFQLTTSKQRKKFFSRDDEVKKEKSSLVCTTNSYMSKTKGRVYICWFKLGGQNWLNDVSVIARGGKTHAYIKTVLFDIVKKKKILSKERIDK